MEIRLFNQIYLNLHKIEFTFKTLFCQHVADGRVMCLEEYDIYSHINMHSQVLNK
jgi:hypothetical protein